MKLSTSGLAQLLLKNAVELRFRRRKMKKGFAPERRMLCTNDALLLNSEAGKRVLHYVKPTHARKYNPATKNLVAVFDIFMQQYRMVDVNSCEVIAVISTQPPDKWWTYFNHKLLSMPSAQKLMFMNN